MLFVFHHSIAMLKTADASRFLVLTMVCRRERMNRLQNADAKPASGVAGGDSGAAASKMSIAALQQRMQTLRGSMQ